MCGYMCMCVRGRGGQASVMSSTMFETVFLASLELSLYSRL